MLISKVSAGILAILLSVNYSFGQELIANFSPGSRSVNYSDMYTGGEHPLFFADNENGSYLLEYRDGQLAIIDSSLIASNKRPLRKLYSDSEKLWYFNTSADSRHSSDSTFVMGTSIIERDLSGNKTSLDTLTFSTNSLDYFWSFGPQTREFLSDEIEDRIFVSGQNRLMEYVDGNIELKDHAFTSSDIDSDFGVFYSGPTGLGGRIFSNARIEMPDSFSRPAVFEVVQDSVHIFENFGFAYELNDLLIIATDLSIDDPNTCTPAVRVFDPSTDSSSVLISTTSPSNIVCQRYGVLPGFIRRSDSLHYYTLPAPTGNDIRYYKVDGVSAIEVSREDLPETGLGSTEFLYQTAMLDDWEYGMVFDPIASGGFIYSLARRNASGDYEVIFKNEIPISNINPFTQKYLLDVISDGRYLYFSGGTRSNGYELWRLNDGVAERMTNIGNGTISSFPFLLGIHGNHLYFETNIYLEPNDPFNQKNLWRLDLSAQPVSAEHDLPSEMEPSVVVYPNPVSSDQEINIQSNVDLKKVEVFDSLGRKLRSHSVAGSGERIRFSSRGLSKGVYFLQASTYDDSVLNHSFVVR